MIDEDYLEAMGGRNNGEMMTILNDFLSTLPARARELKQAMKTGCSDSVQEKAHALKGSARMCGFVDIGDHAELLEKQIKDGSFEEVDVWIEKLLELGRETRTALGVGE